MKNESELTPENIANPQRRTIIKAAAWAAPVVAIAATAPLAAASQNYLDTHVGVQSDSSTFIVPPTQVGSAVNGHMGGSAVINNGDRTWTLTQGTLLGNYAGPINRVGYTYQGTPLVDLIGQTITVAGSFVWQVEYADNEIFALSLTGLPLQVNPNESFTIPSPRIDFSSTLSGTPNSFNPAGTQGTLSFQGTFDSGPAVAGQNIGGRVY